MTSQPHKTQNWNLNNSVNIENFIILYFLLESFILSDDLSQMREIQKNNGQGWFSLFRIITLHRTIVWEFLLWLHSLSATGHEDDHFCRSEKLWWFVSLMKVSLNDHRLSSLKKFSSGHFLSHQNVLYFVWLRKPYICQDKLFRYFRKRQWFQVTTVK